MANLNSPVLRFTRLTSLVRVEYSRSDRQGVLPEIRRSLPTSYLPIIRAELTLMLGVSMLVFHRN